MTRRQLAWILILVVDAAYVLWGAAVAIAPDHVLGPGGKAILPAGFEGYSGGSWSQLVDTAPMNAAYMAVLYRLWGVGCVLFGFMGSAIAVTAFRRGERWAWWTLLVSNTFALIAAMTYDKIVHAIGPFEVTEYLGLLLVWIAFAMTAPRRVSLRPAVATAAVLLSLFLVPQSAEAQSRPVLHVNPRWKQCSIVLDASLSQAAWAKFSREAAQVIWFRPMVGAEPMGRGRFSVDFMQWQTNVDDNTSAWNDTFVHPDPDHWLYEGSGLKFPGLAARVGVASRTDVGVYYTRNFEANYGAYGVQLQQNLVRGAHGFDVAGRTSYVALFGPDDVDLSVVGMDAVTSYKGWTYKRATLAPYAGIATYFSRSHEKAAAVTLEDESATSVMLTMGFAVDFSFLRIATESSISRVPGGALKIGLAY